MSGRYLLCIVIGMCVCVVCQALKCMSFATGVLIFDGVCSGVSCFLVQAHTQEHGTVGVSTGAIALNHILWIHS